MTTISQPKKKIASSPVPPIMSIPPSAAALLAFTVAILGWVLAFFMLEGSAVFATSVATMVGGGYLLFYYGVRRSAMSKMSSQ